MFHIVESRLLPRKDTWQKNNAHGTLHICLLTSIVALKKIKFKKLMRCLNYQHFFYFDPGKSLFYRLVFGFNFVLWVDDDFVCLSVTENGIEVDCEENILEGSC